MPSPDEAKKDDGAANKTKLTLRNTRYEIPSDPTAKGFVIIRQPARNFNVSKDNRIAQRDLKDAGIDYKDWAR